MFFNALKTDTQLCVFSGDFPTEKHENFLVVPTLLTNFSDKPLRNNNKTHTKTPLQPQHTHTHTLTNTYAVELAFFYLSFENTSIRKEPLAATDTPERFSTCSAHQEGRKRWG